VNPYNARAFHYDLREDDDFRLNSIQRVVTDAGVNTSSSVSL